LSKTFIDVLELKTDGKYFMPEFRL